MATTLNVRNPRAHELARELAQRRRTGITEVVIQALEHELERERSTTPLAQRLTALADRARSKAGPNPRPVTEADRDALWER
ncbi:MAG: type II toxin-antitoxin system VapB family antitoxin [Methylobacterium sp.]|jgi:antitoxin VapB|uniref:type II toxin-antitoxin system VapB family antitoxin n=1 Tax=unclassified Methylobacterium TaxID=2615210 RepID=UPI0011C9475F|nr:MULTISPECIES: type II toxin-antitoxin system VapB family antitoxin [unclassified Methylobacterium]MDO9425317.1 type II toxin-antitoxin system VapB family antitoxin [Methylobacterium sp.]TXM76466.1 transcriptional regulator [Methylobacterium sp. WL69]